MQSNIRLKTLRTFLNILWKFCSKFQVCFVSISIDSNKYNNSFQRYQSQQLTRSPSTTRVATPTLVSSRVLLTGSAGICYCSRQGYTMTRLISCFLIQFNNSSNLRKFCTSYAQNSNSRFFTSNYYQRKRNKASTKRGEQVKNIILPQQLFFCREAEKTGYNVN